MSGRSQGPLDRDGAFAGHLAPGTTPALLLVDMVEAYLHPESALYCDAAAAALQTAGVLLAAARGNGRQVIFTNVEYEPGGANGGLFYSKVPALSLFDRGSPLGGFRPPISPTTGDWVVTKQFPSAFFGTGLVDRLRSAGIDTLIIGGFSTSGCVRATALDALQNGFVPLVVPDACADRTHEVHEANLADLKAKYAELIGCVDATKIL